MEAELSLHDYWRIIKKRQWGGLLVFAATFLSTVFYTQLQTPLYRASAAVKFEPPTAKLLGGGGYDTGSILATELRTLDSPDVAARVAKRMNLPTPALPGTVRAGTSEGSNIISLTATGTDPLAVADLANAFADVFIEKDLEERSRQSRSTLNDVESRRAEVERSLRELEDKKRSFMQEHQTAGMASGLASSLAELEFRRRELGKKYTAEHPDMIKLDERIQAMKAKLSRTTGEETELERLVRDMKVNEESYLTLSREYEQAKVAVASEVSWVTILSRAAAPTAPYSPNKRVNFVIGAALGLFLAAMFAFVLENLDISLSTIEDIERLLGVPVLGMIPHFGSEGRWKELRARMLRHQRYPMEVFRSQLAFQYRPKSPSIEVYHSLRANIQNQLVNKDQMVLTFTSSGVAEGKSLTSLNFCLAAAQAGLRTLFVETDVRQPLAHKAFGLPKSPGLVEVLTGKMPWDEVIHGTSDFIVGGYDTDKLIAFSGIDNFKIMTGYAASGSDVVHILSSTALTKLVGDLRPHFDVVVFDCPPVLLFVDALLVGARTDGVVMIYKAGKIARRALKRAKDQIVSARGNIIGVVLNDMRSSDMEPRYGYYYDYEHYAAKDEQDAAP